MKQSPVGRLHPDQFGYRGAYTRRFLGASVCLIGIISVYYLAVRTVHGQLVDTVSMRAIAQFRSYFSGIDKLILGIVSVPTIIVIMVLAALITLLRKRFALSLRVIAVIALSALTSQVLKTYIFSRPHLGVGEHIINSLPSGHVTVAAAAGMALMIAVPHHMRPWFALIGALFTIIMGLAVASHMWHRPSDIIASIFIVTFWALVVTPIEKTTAEHSRSRSFMMGLAIICTTIAVLFTGMAWSMITGSPYYLDNPSNAAALDVLARGSSIVGQMAALSGIVSICATAFLCLTYVDRSMLIAPLKRPYTQH
ncbi:MAG: hypothetical protein Q4P66_07005 [Actinomycetaceae bacterium]|nr:hypothetical protein [Actinomycetaceae bacterium]